MVGAADMRPRVGRSFRAHRWPAQRRSRSAGQRGARSPSVMGPQLIRRIRRKRAIVVVSSRAREVPEKAHRNKGPTCLPSHNGAGRERVVLRSRAGVSVIAYPRLASIAEGALARTGWCWPLPSSEPPNERGVGVRPVGAWRRHLMKQPLILRGRARAPAHCHRRWSRGR